MTLNDREIRNRGFVNFSAVKKIDYFWSQMWCGMWISSTGIEEDALHNAYSVALYF